MNTCKLKTCFEYAKSCSSDPEVIRYRTEAELAKQGIRIGITEVAIGCPDIFAKGYIIDICFSDIWGYYAIFIGTNLFSGTNSNCFIPEAHDMVLLVSN